MYQKSLEIVIAVLCVVGAWWYAGHAAVERYKKEQALDQAKVDKAQQQKYDKLAGEYEELKAKRQENARVVTKNVERIVEKPIYVESCWELDGLRNANAAIRGDSSVSEGAVQEVAGD